MNPIGSLTNFPQGFANGISVRGMPLLQSQPGAVFYLDNSATMIPQQRAGSDSNRGTFLDPFATLNYAVNTACVPGRGDIVFVGAGHFETISSATIATLRTSGVAVIGMGSGSFRPTFNFTTATTANIPITGANISIQNCLFTANYANIASYFTAAGSSFTGVIANGQLTASAVTGTIYPGSVITGTGVSVGTVINSQISGTTGGAGVYAVTGSTTVASTTITTAATDFAIDNCEFRDTSSVLNSLAVFTAPSTDNCCDGFSFTGSKVYGLGTTATTAPFSLGGNLDRMVIQGNFIANALAANSAIIYLPTTSKVLTRILVDSNRCVLVGTNAATGLMMITTATTNTGIISNNFVKGARAIASAILVTGSSGFEYFQNFYQTSADVSGVILPAYQT